MSRRDTSTRPLEVQGTTRSPDPVSPREQAGRQQPAPDARNYADVAGGNVQPTRSIGEFKVSRPVRKATNQSPLHGSILRTTDMVLPYANKDTISYGHTDTRVYDTFEFANDILATREQSSAACRWVINQAEAAIIVNRSEAGQSTIIIAMGVPKKTPKVRPQPLLNRVDFARLSAKDTLGEDMPDAPSTTKYNTSYRVYGEAIWFQALKRAGNSPTRVRDFKGSGYMRADVVVSEATIKKFPQLIFIPTAALETSDHHPNMLTVDFHMATQATEQFNTIRDIAKKHECFATIVNFRGRLLFTTPPTSATINTISADYKGIEYINRPRVQSTDEEGNQREDVPSAFTIAKKVTDGSILIPVNGTMHPDWVDTFAKESRCTVESVQDRFAIVKIPSKQRPKWTNKTVGGVFRCLDYTKYIEFQKEQQRKLAASMERDRNAADAGAAQHDEASDATPAASDDEAEAVDKENDDGDDAAIAPGETSGDDEEEEEDGDEEDEDGADGGDEDDDEEEKQKEIDAKRKKTATAALAAKKQKQQATAAKKNEKSSSGGKRR